MPATLSVGRSLHVPESSFGAWFLRTDVWETYVLKIAIHDLRNLIKNRKPSYPVVVDLGCGSGRSFKWLSKLFAPDLLIGADIDADMLRVSAAESKMQNLNVKLIQGTSSNLAVADQSVDMLFCHQTFHHLVDQQRAIREFHRVLKPGGVLLFAESTRTFIHSWIIRLLFRHPMDVQKSASEYIKVIESAGFIIEPEAISYPFLWWSRTDLGLRESLLGIRPASKHEETLLNVVAVRI
jgi:ubiquinone/menaquinone biosynthesis C-methylase UbiE